MGAEAVMEPSMYNSFCCDADLQGPFLSVPFGIPICRLGCSQSGISFAFLHILGAPRFSLHP